MRAGFRLGPRARMQPGFERNSQKFVPGRVKLDLVEAMTVAVERAQLRRGDFGGGTSVDCFPVSEKGGQARGLSMGPTRPRPRRTLDPNNHSRGTLLVTV